MLTARYFIGALLMLFDELYDSALFKLTDRNYVRSLFKQSLAVQLKADEFLFHQNMIGRGMYFIISGNINILLEINQPAPHAKAKTQEILLSTKKPFSFFGELCMLEECKRTISAKAMEKTEVLYLDNRLLLQGFKENNVNAYQIGINLGRMMTTHIQAMNEYLIKINEHNHIMSMS